MVKGNMTLAELTPRTKNTVSTLAEVTPETKNMVSTLAEVT